MNDVEIFKNPEFGEIRTATKDNLPYFCLSDVCRALDIANSRNVVGRLNEDGVRAMDIIDRLGRKQNAIFINEANLYKTIFQSRKQSAERFTNWVTSEVLPSIRKNGGYIVGQESLSDEELLERAVLVAQKKIAERDKQIAEMKPKAEYFDALVDNKLYTTIRDTAKELSIGERKFVNFLIKNKYVYRGGDGKLKPYAEYAESGKGLFVLKDTQNNRNGWTGVQMFVTPKGKETFRLLLEREVNIA